jgi:hypothetical protein
MSFRAAAQRRTMPTALVKPDHNLSVPVRDRLTLAVATANPLGAGGLGAKWTSGSAQGCAAASSMSSRRRGDLKRSSIRARSSWRIHRSSGGTVVTKPRNLGAERHARSFRRSPHPREEQKDPLNPAAGEPLRPSVQLRRRLVAPGPCRVTPDEGDWRGALRRAVA